MSDSNMSARSGLVVGTAGHVDHGKTSLVYRLTGMDTDRLAEEKSRGISIDLGFAHLDLPSGHRISFVDVPGHERFVRNMLAGAAGMGAVLLVVSAEEGIKPQTREHFSICRLLGVERGLIVLTKSDLVSASHLASVSASVRQWVAGSFLERAPLLPVSVVTGDGLDPLRAALDQLASSASMPVANGLARLPLDRAFSLKGFGTVVTGTLIGGSLHVGEAVELQPSGQTARIRGLQVNGSPVQRAEPGRRTAVNLSGIEHSAIHRGFTLLHPGNLVPTANLQAAVEWLSPADDPFYTPSAEHSPVKRKPKEVLLHVGTAEVPAQAKILSSGSSGAPSLLHLRLHEPVLALPGDRFVLRRPSPAQTIGGGVIIDCDPPKRLSAGKAAARLSNLLTASLVTRLEFFVAESANGVALRDLVRRTGSTVAALRTAILSSSQLILLESPQRVITHAWRDRKREDLLRLLKEFHMRNPSLAGAPVAQARLGLEPALAQVIFADFPAVRLDRDTIALATHRPGFSQQEAAALAGIEQKFRQAVFQPPPLASVPRALLERLIKDGRLVRISAELVFHADTISHIRKSLAAHKGRRFSVPEFKDWMQISRKYAIPLLEYLDHQRVTRRDGEHRIVL